MKSSAFFADLLQTIADRGRELLGRVRRSDGLAPGDLAAACETLLSSRGEASGVALAREILIRWETLDDAARLEFLKMLAERFGPDFGRIDEAVAAYLNDKSAAMAQHLHGAAEARRQELVRRLNLAPGGVEALVEMRELLLRHRAEHPEFPLVDADFEHLFSSWFNRGFLVLRRIDWSTPANILEKIIRYEAVHTIHDWNDLRRRLEPSDRRCFAFFHPQLTDDPLIFVEVALTEEPPSAIADLLAEERTPIAANDATTAVFYSISNCQEGLRGISFGNFLIKQVVDELRRELPRLENFVTLSPVPGFATWLARERRTEASLALSQEDQRTLGAVDEDNWHIDPPEALRKTLLSAAAYYFLKARTPKGTPVDPVARFHLGNGARLERLNFLGDLSARAMKQAHGLMVNYCYRLHDIEKNHELFVSKGQVAAAPEVRRLLREDRGARTLVLATDENSSKSKQSSEKPALATQDRLS
ncbi:malonyl-CoA decarboxylase [Dongia deserti]|uniref:malonyl-CoA decarboxylase n=1 Tax=Dongia deserti TaxID=2268030 RepID=UPI000E65D550|nr:malonyl-CoA decarboxylase [Dongia deserti]